MTYFWSLYLNLNFCAVRSLFPDPLTNVLLKFPFFSSVLVLLSLIKLAG